MNTDTIKAPKIGEQVIMRSVGNRCNPAYNGFTGFVINIYNEHGREDEGGDWIFFTLAVLKLGKLQKDGYLPVDFNVGENAWGFVSFQKEWDDENNNE